MTYTLEQFIEAFSVKETGESAATEVRKAATDAISVLESHAKFGWLGDDIAGIRSGVTLGDQKLTQGKHGEAYAAWEGVVTRCSTAFEDCEKYKAYKVKYKEVADLLAELKKHTQKAHVATEISQTTTLLSQAVGKENIGDPVAATSRVAEAKVKVGAGKTHADGYQGYKTHAAPMMAGYAALLVVNKAWTETNLKGSVDTANARASVGRDYPGAKLLATAASTEMKNLIIKHFYTDSEAKITGVINGDAGAYVKPETDEMTRLRGLVQTDANGGSYMSAVTKGRQVLALITGAKKLAVRYHKYEQARASTVLEVNKVKAEKGLMGQLFSINKLMEKADQVASHEVMRIEMGIDRLGEIRATTAELLKMVVHQKAYITERKEVVDGLEELKKAKTVDHLGDHLDRIGGFLDRAALLAGSVDAENPSLTRESDAGTIDFGAARTEVALAKSELGAAKALSLAVAGMVELEGKVGKAGTSHAITQLIGGLLIELEKLTADPEKLRISAETGPADEHLTAATQKLGKDIPGAKEELGKAASLILKGQGVLSQYAQYKTLRQAQADRVVELNKRSSKDPNKPKIEAITKHLLAADGLADGRDWGTASARLRTAAAAAEEAEVYATEWETHATQHKLLSDRKDNVVDLLAKGEINGHLVKAGEHAAEFAFQKARQERDKAEGLLDLQGLRALKAGADPQKVDKIVALAERLMEREAETLRANPLLGAKEKEQRESGAAQQLDKFVQELELSDFRLLRKLARVRFGVEWKSDAGDRVVAGKRMWKMMAMCPDPHVRDNPSMKTVKRERIKDDFGNPTWREGGYYSPSEDLVVMHGRGGGGDQEFGSQALRPNGEKKLPDDLEESCQPVNEDPISYFDWATLHEVGHAVDDRLGFMDSRAGDLKFGGWTVYSSGMDEIATAVSNTTGCDREYVLARLNGVDPDPPGDDTGLSDFNDWFAIAGKDPGYVWWSHADSNKITMNDGYVYQRAYTNKWIRYKADARKRGISGYQFRAPGEWFAELYAAYHSDKLKKQHPSRAWLAAL